VLQNRSEELLIHEVGLARSILHILEDSAQQHCLARIQRVTLEVGQFSGVNIDALQFAFEAIFPGTILESARFDFVTPPLLLFCRTCREAYAGDFEDTSCPICLQSDFKVMQGQELNIRSIEGA